MSGYVARSDPKAGVAVWCWKGSEVSSEDWARHIDDMKALRQWPKKGPRPSVLIHLVDSRFVPNAQQRRELAEAAAHADYRPNIAVVTSNPLIRGCIQALSWFQSQPGYRIQPFKHVSDAIAWLESDRGARLPISGILASAHRDLGVQELPIDDDQASSLHR